MGQSLVQNYIHLVFSTKHRQPMIDVWIEEELHKYLGGICNALDCQVIKVGGYTDHVHILFKLSKSISLMEVTGKLKSNSSRWIKSNGDRYKTFAWQNGYGAFSVDSSQIDRVVAYIKDQHDHHRQKTFQEEYRKFLIENEVEFDERYVWD